MAVRTLDQLFAALTDAQAAPVPREPDDVAAILAERVPAASAGTQLRSNEIVFWAEVPDGEQAGGVHYRFQTGLRISVDFMGR